MIQNTVLKALVKAVTAHIKKHGPIEVSSDDIKAAQNDGNAVRVMEDSKSVKLILVDKEGKDA